MKSLDELRVSKVIEERRLYYFVSKDWEKAEDDEWCHLREEAYSHTRNWQKAENDEWWAIRLEAYENTGNWKKAENDEDVYIRMRAFGHTNNWEKAKNDCLDCIRTWAKKILSYKNPTKSIKQQLLDLPNSLDD